MPHAALWLFAGKNFEDYKIEQQGRIVEHYYLLREGRAITGAPPLSVYEKLIPFIGGRQL